MEEETLGMELRPFGGHPKTLRWRRRHLGWSPDPSEGTQRPFYGGGEPLGGAHSP